MDAPKGRYRVEEKDGRLVVIDTATGARVSPDVPSPPGTAPASPSRPAAGLARPPGLADRLGRLLSTSPSAAGTKRPRRPRLGVGGEWPQAALGRGARWGSAAAARPGAARLRRFPGHRPALDPGRFELLWLFVLALPATFWGVWAVVRLQRETAPARLKRRFGRGPCHPRREGELSADAPHPPPLAVASLLLPGGAAPATSFGPRTPHDPKLGCKAIKQVVAD